MQQTQVSVGKPVKDDMMPVPLSNGSADAPPAMSNDYDAYKEYENTSFEVSEDEVLRDVIYALQGIDGKHVKYDSVEDCFQIDPLVGMPRSTRDQISKLCELGWMYMRISRFVQEVSGYGQGLVIQAFASAIEHELSHYYKLIAVLEQQLACNSITLKRLTVWSAEPTDRLRLMLILVDMAGNRRGSSLTSELYALSSHGDPFTRNFVRNVLSRTCVPIFSFIRSWVFEGILEDPFEEFWVASDENVKIDELWKSKYSLRSSMIPSFINVEFAEQILSIGRTINFITKCCEDNEWQVDQAYQITLTFDDLQKLESVINIAAKATNKRVMDLLFNKYKLQAHFSALKQYMLLGQGDFIQHLLEMISPDLNKPGTSIVRHTLLGILESAIRSSNAQYDDPDITGRLDIRMISDNQITSSNKNISQMHQTQDGMGWDMFTLTYIVNPPLDTIFTKDVLRVYIRIFKHLWRIKRVDAMLDATWMKHQELAKVAFGHRKSNVSRKFQPILHLCNLLRHEMVHFCNNLQYYFMFEVIENQWQTLVDKIKKIKELGNGDLKSLIEAHEKYVKDIIRQALLSRGQSNLKSQLDKTINIIMQFVNMQDMIYADAITLLKVDRMDDSEEDEDLNVVNGNVSSMLNGGGNGMSDYGVVDKFGNKLLEVQRLFRENERLFVQMLKSPSVQHDNMLQYLTFRLEFMTGGDEQQSLLT
ncbi:Tubgcp3 [Acrasis kona]|uniref:Tubgcp3 n=1 Tax=Acrasis kona TaxID=1008807 RepID=A0AAW2ZC44_9EUKA